MTTQFEVQAKGLNYIHNKFKKFAQDLCQKEVPLWVFILLQSSNVLERSMSQDGV